MRSPPLPQLPLHKRIPSHPSRGVRRAQRALGALVAGSKRLPKLSGRIGVWLEFRRPLACVPNTGLALVEPELDPSMIPKGLCEVAMEGGDTLRGADVLRIVEERKHALAWLPPGREGGVLGDCVQCRIVQA